MKKLILFFLLFCGSVRAEVVPTVYSEALDRFEVAYTGSGYMESSEFITFLDRAEGGVTEQSFYQKFSDDPVVFFEKWGLWYTILLILVGGLALNLTPCVLPMIPVNLAIIGAGVQSKSRKTGFMLGSVYGLGITLVYGILGLAVVLGGARFGTLNSSPWFNFSIALIFLILSLAMFDLFHIDLSRFQSKFGGRFSGHGYWAAFGGGALSALLAGACVAPVVIAVLLLASNLYASGIAAGLALPFVLGLGMGLPWPFAGSGLSFLPKPGAWMDWVKRAFGVIILLFVVYYGWLGGRLLKTGGAGQRDSDAVAVYCDSAEKLNALLNEAYAANKPVFIDFWAEWCKNCHAMESTTFRDAAVKKRLERYSVIQFDATRSKESPARELLDRFSVVGLPTYVILTPKL